MKKQENNYYVGTDSAGIFGVRAVRDPFVTNTGSRRMWAIIIAILFITALAAGIIFTNLLRQRYLERNMYPTPEEAAMGEVGKGLISLGATQTDILELREDPEETARAIVEYIGSEEAAARGWSGEELRGHFLAYYAEYMARYDHNKSVMNDGRAQMYLYLIQDAGTGEWEAVGSAKAPIG